VDTRAVESGPVLFPLDNHLPLGDLDRNNLTSSTVASSRLAAEISAGKGVAGGEQSTAMGRVADVLVGGLADGFVSSAENSFNLHTVAVAAESLAVGYGLGALSRLGTVGQGLALAGGVAMGASSLYGEWQAGRVQATAGAVVDAYNSGENLAQDRNVVAATGGALAFDTALAIGTGGLGMRRGLKLTSEWPSTAVSSIKSSYSGVVDFLSTDGRSGGRSFADSTAAYAGQDALGGKAVLSPIDARAIKPGTDSYPNDHLHLIREADGQLKMRARSNSDGIYSQIEAGKNVFVGPDTKVYFGDRRNDDLIRAAAQSLRPGCEDVLTANRVVGKDSAGNIFVREDGKSPTGTFVQSSRAGQIVSVDPADKFIHLGPHGKVEINQPVAKVFQKVSLAPVDTSLIAPGGHFYPNDYVKLFRSPSGELSASGRSLSDGIYTKVAAGKNILVKPDAQIYFGDQRFDAAVRSAGQNLKPGEEEAFSAHRTVGKSRSGQLYLRDDGASSHGTFMKGAEPGYYVEIKPSDRFVHLGPLGMLEIKQAVAPIAPPPQVAPITPIAKPVIAPVAPPAAPIAPIARPVPPPIVPPPLSPEIRDFAGLYSGNKKILDNRWRHGQYADVVISPAKGGIEKPGGWIQSLYETTAEARSSARFIAGIFRRRLQTDPNDLMTAPGTKTYYETYRSQNGQNYYVPRVEVDGIGAGSVVLDGTLQPAGLLDHTGRVLRINQI